MNEVATEIDWKDISRRVFEELKEDGAAVVALRGEVPEGRFRFERGIPTYEVEQEKGSPKGLRSYWWEHRTSGAVRRETGAVWAIFEEGKLKSGFAYFEERSY